MKNKTGKKKGIFILLAAALLVFLLSASFLMAGRARAQEKGVDLYIFYDKACPYCDKARNFLAEIGGKYPDLTIREFEVGMISGNRSEEAERNEDLMVVLADVFGARADGVPVIFIGNRVFVGFGEAAKAQIEAEITGCLQSGCVLPIDRISDMGLPAGNSEFERLENMMLAAAGIFFAAVFAAVLALIFKFAGKKARKQGV